MTTAVLTKPKTTDAAKIDPLAEIRSARNELARKDIAEWRELIFKAAGGDTGGTQLLAEILYRRGWSDQILATDLEVARDDLAQRDFGNTFNEVQARLSEAVRNGPLEKLSVSIGFVDHLIARLNNPAAFEGRLVNVPAEVIAARDKLRQDSAAYQEHSAKLQQLRYFRSWNPRLFSGDMEIPLRVTEAGVNLNRAATLQAQGAIPPWDLPIGSLTNRTLRGI